MIIFRRSSEKKAIRRRIHSADIDLLKIEFHDGKPIVYITPSTMSRIVNSWLDARDESRSKKTAFVDPTPPYLFIAKEKNGAWSVCEGETGECFCETYARKRTAMRWLLGDYNCLEELEEADDPRRRET